MSGRRLGDTRQGRRHPPIPHGTADKKAFFYSLLEANFRLIDSEIPRNRLKFDLISGVGSGDVLEGREQGGATKHPTGLALDGKSLSFCPLPASTFIHSC